MIQYCLLSLLFFVAAKINASDDLLTRLSKYPGYDRDHQDDSLPGCFRTMQDPFPLKKIDSNKVPSRLGLDLLQASSGSQFSRRQLIHLYTMHQPHELIIVDLREEAHGFCNDKAISWYFPSLNQYNHGKPKDEIIQDELERLSNLTHRQATITSFPGTGKLKRGQTDVELDSVYAVTTYTEKALVESFGMRYVRIMVTDHQPPSDEAVDEFISLIDSLKPHEWLYIHCRKGQGRSTTFLAMYDMLKNAHQVSLDDMLDRQYVLGCKNLKTDDNSNRYHFVKDFYKYAKARHSGFTGTWQQFKNEYAQKHAAINEFKDL